MGVHSKLGGFDWISRTQKLLLWTQFMNFTKVVLLNSILSEISQNYEFHKTDYTFDVVDCHNNCTHFQSFWCANNKNNHTTVTFSQKFKNAFVIKLL